MILLGRAPPRLLCYLATGHGDKKLLAAPPASEREMRGEACHASSFRGAGVPGTVQLYLPTSMCCTVLQKKREGKMKLLID